MNDEKKSLSGKSLRMKMAMGSAVIILFLLLTNNYYAMNVVRNQVSISTQNLVSLTMAHMDESLDDVEKYLLTMMVGNDDFHMIETARKADQVTFSEVELQEEYYLFRVFWFGKAYLGAWVNVGTQQQMNLKGP